MLTNTFSENAFDAVKIASKLRELGDDYDEKFIQPLIKNVQNAPADQVRLLSNQMRPKHVMFPTTVTHTMLSCSRMNHNYKVSTALTALLLFVSFPSKSETC